MRVYLMRHGIAIDREDPACPQDPDRNLTPKGIERTAAAARGLVALKIQLDAMLTSPYLRAVQTAEIACQALGFSVRKLRRTEALLPERKPAELLGDLARLKAEGVMCFGHAPNLDLVIASAVGCERMFTDLKKAGVACLDFESLEPPRAMLVGLFSARALRLLGE